MNIRETFRSAIRAIIKNKRRSFLTMLGFIIGIASVITIMALGRGFENAVIQNLTSNQSSDVVMNILFQPYDANLRGSSTPFYDASDVELAMATPGVESVEIGNLDRGFSTLEAVSLEGGRERTVQLMVSTDPPGERILEGRPLDGTDEETSARTVIVSSSAAESLLGSRESYVGQSLEIQGQMHTIVGVYEGGSLSSQNMTQLNFDLYMPEATHQRYYEPESAGINMMLTISRGAVPKDVAEQVTETLELLGSMKEEGSYFIFDMALMLDGIGNILSMITIFISAIAGISLLIAGVGVMNMMYISVSERTKEIGIRRALGATKNSIRNQFLLEGLAITLVGGFSGLALGFLIARVLSGVLPFEPVVDLNSVLVTTVISGSIGLFFSLMPADSAARKDLIDIMR